MRDAVLIVRCSDHEHVLSEEGLREFVDNADAEPMPECLVRAIVSDWLYNAKRLREELFPQEEIGR